MAVTYLQSTKNIAQKIVEVNSISKSSIVGRCALASFGYWWQDHPEYHSIVSCKATESHILIEFSNSVSLIIKTPKDAEHFDGSLIIWSVDSLSWKWKGYGKGYSQDNHFYRKYRSIKGNMYCGTHEGKNHVWRYAPRPYHPALVLAWDLPSGPPGPFLSRLRDRGKERFLAQQIENRYLQANNYSQENMYVG